MTHTVGDIDNSGGYVSGEQEICGKSLHLPLNFCKSIIALKIILRNKKIQIKNQWKKMSKELFSLWGSLLKA